MKTLEFELMLEVEDHVDPYKLAMDLEHALAYLIDRDELDDVLHMHRARPIGKDPRPPTGANK